MPNKIETLQEIIEQLVQNAVTITQALTEQENRLKTKEFFAALSFKLKRERIKIEPGFINLFSLKKKERMNFENRFKMVLEYNYAINMVCNKEMREFTRRIDGDIYEKIREECGDDEKNMRAFRLALRTQQTQMVERMFTPAEKLIVRHRLNK